MTNKIITSVFLTAALFFGAVNLVSAKTVCTQNYGQPVVCTEEVEQVLSTHTPVETGLKENLAAVGAVMVASSLVLRYRDRLNTR